MSTCRFVGFAFWCYETLGIRKQQHVILCNNTETSTQWKYFQGTHWRLDRKQLTRWQELIISESCPLKRCVRLTCFVLFCVGHRVLTIQGSNLGGQDNGSVVLVGMKECVTVQWNTTEISCLLPVLPPGIHKVDVRVGNRGFPQTRCMLDPFPCSVDN